MIDDFRADDAVVTLVADDANDGAPWIGRRLADAPADRGGRLLPVLAREVLADHHDRPPVEGVVPRHLTAGDDRVAHRLEIVLCRPLEPAEGRQLVALRREVFDKDRVVAVEPVHRDRARHAHRSHAGDLLQLAHDLLVRPNRLLVVGNERFRNRHPQGQDLFRTNEAGRDLAHGEEGPNHQARGDQQDDRQGDFGDDEGVARAVTLAPRTRQPSAFFERRGQVRRRQLDDWQKAEEQPGDERDPEREEHHHRIDADLGGAWQAIRGVGDQRPDTNESQTRPTIPPASASARLSDSSSQAIRRDAGAERGMNGELLLPCFRAHEEQVRDICARDEQHEADGAEQDPEHAPDIADDVDRERPHVGGDLDVVKHLSREPLGHRESFRHDRNEARHIGVRLLDGHARFQSRDASGS